jgi:hypothetical protein
MRHPNLSKQFKMKFHSNKFTHWEYAAFFELMVKMAKTESPLKYHLNKK